MDPLLLAFYGGVIPAVLGLMGLIKPLLETGPLPVSGPRHDPVLRLLTEVLAILGTAAVYLVYSQDTTWRGLAVAAGIGLVNGLASMGLYNAAQGKVTPGSELPAAQP